MDAIGLIQMKTWFYRLIPGIGLKNHIKIHF